MEEFLSQIVGTGLLISAVAALEHIIPFVAARLVWTNAAQCQLERIADTSPEASLLVIKQFAYPRNLGRHYAEGVVRDRERIPA